jgi:hypothetical protein
MTSLGLSVRPDIQAKCSALFPPRIHCTNPRTHPPLNRTPTTHPHFPIDETILHNVSKLLTTPRSFLAFTQKLDGRQPHIVMLGVAFLVLFDKDTVQHLDKLTDTGAG